MYLVTSILYNLQLNGYNFGIYLGVELSTKDKSSFYISNQAHKNVDISNTQQELVRIHSYQLTHCSCIIGIHQYYYT